MGICGSSPVVNRGELNLAELGSKAKSPEPRLELAEYKNVQAIDATVLGELYRAGLVNLSQKKEHCNFINVFPVPGTLSCLIMYMSFEEEEEEEEEEESRSERTRNRVPVTCYFIIFNY